jgi:hypothetical protein
VTLQAAFTDHVTVSFDWPFFTGTAVAADLLAAFPAALNGRPYMIDTQVEHTFTDYWQHESIPLIRTQADGSQFPNEATLNPEGLWRRFQDSAHEGAGQVYLDRDSNTSPYRFHASKGIDPWTIYKLSLLPTTTQALSSSNTNLRLAVAGADIYVTDGQVLKYSGDLSSWTSVTGNPSVTALSVCSDGYNVYTAYNASGIYKTTRAAASQASYVTGTVALVAYVKGRLMAAQGAAIYNIVAAGALPTALFTQANTDFSWVGFAEGQAAIYAAGYSGDKSLIYRIAVKPDASSLDQPIIAGELPDGEIIRSIEGYLGFVVLGTDKGWRFCDVDAQGNLTIGLLVTTANPVYAFEPQDRFIWYGNTNYDSTSTGLGRMDISVFPQALTPAYASDLMVTGQGAVYSIASFTNLRVFTVSGLGVYKQSTNKVTSGTLTTGLISFGIPDEKTSMYLDIRTEPLVGSYSASISVDNGAYTQIGSTSATNGTGDQYPTGQTIGQHFEIQFTLTRSGTDNTSGPVFERWTFKAFPTLNDGSAETIRVPFLLYESLEPWGISHTMDVGYERDIITSLRATRQVCVLQTVGESYTGFVNDYHWVPHQVRKNAVGQWISEGTMVIEFKRLV